MFLYVFDYSNIWLPSTKKHCNCHRTEGTLLRMNEKPIFICAGLASPIFHVRSEQAATHGRTCSRDSCVGGNVSRRKGAEGRGCGGEQSLTAHPAAA